MADQLNLSNPHRTIHVGVVLLDGATEILDVAPADFIHCLSKEFLGDFLDEVVPENLKSQALDMQFHWVTETGASVTSGRLTCGISTIPTDSYKTCPPLDIVLYGAHAASYVPTETELAFTRKVWNECTAFITICGGVEVPLRAGILKGKTATGPRFALEHYRQMASDTNWVEQRWVRDGKLWTSGALTNGQDLMYAFTHTFWGQREDALVKHMAKLGSWINRDVDYKDEPW